jgi:hypothetical protein
MKALNITYYSGQIREEYRGDLALFLEEATKDGPHFVSFPMGSSDLLKYTSGTSFPMRSYLGVNEESEARITERFNQGNLQSAFNLDVVIIRKEVVQRKLQEVKDLVYSHAEAMIATGK